MQAERLFDEMVDATLESACRFRAAGLKIGEEVSFANQVAQESVGAAESFMCVPPSPASRGIPRPVWPSSGIASFGGEVSILAPPGMHELEPIDCLVSRVDSEESATELKQRLACRGARIECEVGSEIHPDVEEAALHSRVWPVLAQCGLYAGAAVAHHHSRWWDLAQERTPRRC